MFEAWKWKREEGERGMRSRRCIVSVIFYQKFKEQHARMTWRVAASAFCIFAGIQRE